MSAGVLDITIEQGATFTRTLTLTNPDNSRIDLTGHVFRGKVRKNLNDASALADFSFTLLDQTNPTTKGQVTWTMSAATTAGLPIPASPQDAKRPLYKALYDVESEIGGVVTRWLEGAASISPEVTK